MSKADLLLEIGSEEIPAGYIAPAVAELARRVEKWLDDRGLGFEPGGVRTFATPRRLAVRIEGVDLVQATRTELRLGPPVKNAYDAEGNLTKAGEGFARSAGVDPSQLKTVSTDKGDRLAADVTTGGASTRELLLAELDLADLLQLGFPKTMRWIPGVDFRYARPVRWIVALLGDEPVPLRLHHLEASRLSRGHRTLAPGPVEIPSPADYESALAAASVVVGVEERRDRIETAAHERAASIGGVLVEDPELLDEVTNLVEMPTPVLGSFEPERVEQLPPEVIITAMRSHQRYFSLRGADGRLLPHFLTFRDGGERGLAQIAEGNERVLRARLADAAFYWDEDRSVSSDEKLERLARVVWLEGYGSIKDKCERIEALAVDLASRLGVDVDEHLLRRAARLCKTDLATEMIRDGKEFTKLQGVIGRYYALEAGEPVEVADAIREHLHPKSAADRLPEGPLGTLVGLADRLDSIAGCVLAGFAPTGGQDPYALRRQALAVLKILEHLEARTDLEELASVALAAYDADEAKRAGALETIADLFWARLESTLSELPVEIVRGVLSVSPLDPVDNVRAARALAVLQGSESFARLLEGAKRCRNILVKEQRLAEEELEGAARAHRLREAARERWQAWRTGEGLGFDPSLFVDAAETALYEAVHRRIPRLASAAAEADHSAVFSALAELGPSISTYFDEVLVNAEDPAVRQNRLAFLESIHYLFARFADLSRVSVA